MNNDNDFFHVKFRDVGSTSVSTEVVLPELTEGQKGAAWLELELLKETYWKACPTTGGNRQIIFFNYK